jgi:triacylglycerol lipase
MPRFKMCIGTLTLPVLLSLLAACDDGTSKTSADFKESEALGPDPSGAPTRYPIVLASAWGLRFNELAGDSHVRAALDGLSEARAVSFNAENLDDPSVVYQSWAGVSSVAGLPNSRDKVACEGKILGGGRKADAMNPLLALMAATVAGPDLIPNDGLVAVESAKWGRFRGCLPADHLDEVGQIRHDRPDIRTKFDHVRFYRNVAFELAELGSERIHG